MLEYHRSLLLDWSRTRAYSRALEAVLRSGDVVLDLGTGSGILAFLACRAGAARVYAVERTEVIEVARAVADANGMADRIVFLRGDSREVDLPEPVDVIVTETMGSLALDEGLATHLPDARDRFLRPDGRIIPQTLTVHAAPAEAPDTHTRHVGFWAARPWGLDFGPALSHAASTFYLMGRDLVELLAEPLEAFVLDTRTLSGDTVSRELEYTTDKGGVLHGVAVWFDTVLAPGVGVTSAPGSPIQTWTPSLLPLAHPVELARGDHVRVYLEALPTTEGAVWNWEVEVTFRDGRGPVLEQRTSAGWPGRKTGGTP